MAATDQNPQQRQTLKGLFDALREDEEMQKRMRQLSSASAQIAQPFNVVQPQMINANSGLLQQPQMVNMTSGTGIMGLQPSQDEDGSKKEAMIRLMKYLGMA